MKKIGVALLLVLFIIFAFSCQSVSLVEKSRTISVQGTGKVSVSPDVASFSITVSELGETTREAQLKTNEKIGALLAMIRAQGVLDEDLSTTALEFYPEYRWKDNEQIFLGQRVRQTLHVSVKGIDNKSTLLSTLIDEIGTVTNISISTIKFSKEDTSSEYAESRKLAMEKAIEKASEYAHAAHMKVGKPLTVSDYSSADVRSSSQPTLMKASGAYMMESGANAEVPTGTLDIVSTVSVIFELQ